jgi:predicted AlkP superfamily pyrophosphatase or phosphodiesterase
VFDSLRNKTWEKILPDSCYDLSTFDSFPGENNGPDVLNSFPHELKWDSANTKLFTRTYLYVSPFADEELLNLSQEAVTVEQLGKDNIPDLLAISLSSSDAIGHTFGPNSQEIQDYYIRMDRKLGEWFAFLDSTVGTQSYVVALSSDHGVLPLPEYLDMFGIPSERILAKTMESDLEQITTRMESEGIGKKDWVKGNPQEIYLVPDTAISDSLKNTTITRLQNEIRLMPYVADAYTRKQLTAKADTTDPYLIYYRNSFFPARFADLIVRYKENNLMFASQYGTTHGTPYWYDRHVPILFYGTNIAHGRSSHYARTVDIAATIADILKIAAPKNADGESLIPEIHHQ